MGAMTAPTLVGPRVTLRAYRDDDRLARQRHGWHREIERGYGDDTPTRAMTDDEVEDAEFEDEADEDAEFEDEADGEVEDAEFEDEADEDDELEDEDGEFEGTIPQLGAVAGRIEEILPAAEIIRRTVAEFDDTLRALADRYITASTTTS